MCCVYVLVFSISAASLPDFVQELRDQAGQAASELAARLEKETATCEIVAKRLKAQCWDAMQVWRRAAA